MSALTVSFLSSKETWWLETASFISQQDASKEKKLSIHHFSNFLGEVHVEKTMLMTGVRKVWDGTKFPNFYMEESTLTKSHWGRKSASYTTEPAAIRSTTMFSPCFIVFVVTWPLWSISFLPFLSILGKNWTNKQPLCREVMQTIPRGPAQCQTTSGQIWPRRHEAGGGHKVKSAQEGKERDTRVGIVGILAARPAKLPVICFVVNADSRGDMSDRNAGHKSPIVLWPLMSAGLSVSECECAKC